MLIIKHTFNRDNDFVVGNSARHEYLLNDEAEQAVIPSYHGHDMVPILGN